MSTRVITPEAMLSYPHLFKPQAAQEGGKAKYSATLVFAAGADLAQLKAAVMEVLVEKYGADKAAAQAKKLRLPFRDGEEKDYPEGSVFINCRSDKQPGVVSIYPGPDGKPTLIMDPEEVYPGCIVRASVTAFYYDNNGNKGISFALNNLQKLRDGDRLDGRRRAEDEFDADASAAADLAALAGVGANEDEAPAKGGKARSLEDLLK